MAALQTISVALAEPFVGRFQLLQGDITQDQVEAIVNAANSSLLGGGGVDGAIHRAAGPELLHECRTLGGCPTGEARITGGYRLPARYVIHTVGPVWEGGDGGEAALLRNCYDSVFRLIHQHQIKSVAFPAISCGVYGYPLDAAAQIAIAAMREALRSNSMIEQIHVVAFTSDVVDAYRRVLAESAKE